MDSVFENNILLTATERLMMSGRPKEPKYARNKNILVIGGSGSGKTRFFVKPNLMQMHSSYCVTDPKGTILVECGKMLKRGKYKIKVLNTINFAKSIKEILQGWVMDNLTTMFTDVNDKVGTIAGEVGRTPSSWNSGVFSMIENLSENVMIPIAGMIISAILCYELITMVMDKNNMHEVGSEFFFRYLIKACIAVLLLSYTFDITMAIFDVGNHIVTRAGGIVSGSTTIDVTDTLKTMFDSQIDTMGIGELIGLGIETMIVSLCMKIISLLITVMLFGRMIEIYLYISVAPVPFATFSNREWGGIGNNYIKGLCSLAFQGFFIMVCVAIYAVLVSGIAVADNLHTALWSVAAYTVVLCFSLFKTGSLAKSIWNAH